MFSRWRLHRRIFHESFRQSATPTYHPMLLRNTHKMLLSFLQDPTDYTNHFMMLVAIFHLSRRDADLRQVSFFIYTVNCIWLWAEGQRRPYRPYHAQVHRIVSRRCRARCYYDNGNLPFPYVHTCAVCQILTTLVVLRLPTWFPGATFKRASVECLRAGHDVKEIAFQDLKERMVNHISRSKGTINWISST
jgi:hypothetical protein